jgi:hypothetical protein
MPVHALLRLDHSTFIQENGVFVIRSVTFKNRTSMIPMTYLALIALLLETGRLDWLRSDRRGVFTLKRDLNVRIVENKMDKAD